MKNKFSTLLLLLASANALATVDTCKSYPYLSPRSQSVNAARELAGWQPHINLFEGPCFYSRFTMTPEFTRSFHPSNYTTFLFGQDLQTLGTNKDVLVVSGSAVPNRNTTQDWLAEYFGLPSDFRSEITFSPQITNFLVDFNLYFGLNEWKEGLYFRIHAPVVWSRWMLRAEETITSTGTNGYVNGFVNAQNLTLPLTANNIISIPRTDLATSWLATMDGNYIFGDMNNALKYGKIGEATVDGSSAHAASKQTLTRLSDIQLALGLNFLQNNHHHLGLQFRASIPTGSKPTGEYLFEPTVGNGHHWEVGVGLSSHVTLWQGCDEDQYVGLWLDANLTHLFNAKQRRSFDLKNKVNSRYMLVEEMISTTTNLLVDMTAPNVQYARNLLPLINITSVAINVGIAVQGDAVLKVGYVNNCFECDLGYNVWGRSGESFSATGETRLNEKKYALKGTAPLYGFENMNNASPVPLSTTVSNATIHQGNQPIDNPHNAFQQNPAAQLNAINSNATPPVLIATISSNPALILSAADVDIADTPSAYSNKLFGSMSYAWKDITWRWKPFLSIGGEVEFGGVQKDCHSAISQWGIWLKGGLDFN